MSGGDFLSIKSWFVNKSTTQSTNSNNFYQNYPKQIMNKVLYPVKIMPRQETFNHNKSFMQATPSTSLNYTDKNIAK